MRVQWVLLARTASNDGTYAMSKVPINTEPKMWISVVGSKRPACSGRSDSWVGSGSQYRAAEAVPS
jgi:hypothetical protein